MAPDEAKFRVVYSQAIRASLDGHVDALLQGGWQAKFVTTLVQVMDDNLRGRPREFGEPLYTLRAINVRIAIGFVRPLAVQFGVHEESRSVFVRKIMLMTLDD